MEIEVKAKVGDLAQIKKKLIELGAEFSTITNQDDYFYKPKGREMEDQGPGSMIIRVRKESKMSFLTIKAMTGTTGVWEEHETEIKNPEETRKIIEKMGYSHIFEMNKSRETGKIGGICLCLDNVRQLGKYLEAEVIGNNPEEAKQKILGLFKKIGIQDSQIEPKGYARIISENMGVKFRGVK